MHDSVMAWVGEVVRSRGLQHQAVLEIGSMDVNGTCRPLFHEHTHYLGVDIRPGPGVDHVVEPGGPLPSRSGGWDVVVCTEVLEHDIAPWRTLAQAHTVARAGALAIVTCRGIGFPLHEHPGDHWRFSRDGLSALLSDQQWVPVEVVTDPEHPGVFALAMKPQR